LLWLGNVKTSGYLVGRPTCAPATTRLTPQPVGISTVTTPKTPTVVHPNINQELLLVRRA